MTTSVGDASNVEKKSKLSFSVEGVKSIFAPGIVVQNSSSFPIIVVLSQLTPLHWTKVDVGETKRLDCGRVFFSISFNYWSPAKEPTVAEVLQRTNAITTATFIGGSRGLIAQGGLSGFTSVTGLQLTGVLADGKTIMIKDRLSSEDGTRSLYLHNIDIV